VLIFGLERRKVDEEKGRRRGGGWSLDVVVGVVLPRSRPDGERRMLFGGLRRSRGGIVTLDSLFHLSIVKR
jgi:hypothetical protein